MRIAQVAPLVYSVPPPNYGGVELFLHVLVEELVDRGHQVTLFGTGDSRTRANVRPITPRSVDVLIERGEAGIWTPYHNAAMAMALTDAHEYDVIHAHLGCWRVPFGTLSGVPVLHTLHDPIEVDDVWIALRFPRERLVALSHDQISDIPAERRSAISVIYHGCRFRELFHPRRRGDYLLFLGRMTPEKNPVDAVRIARAAGYRLRLAGTPSARHEHEQRYFKERVAPLIDGDRVVYVGAVDQRQKQELLDRALALLFPITWREPFGLVMIEALEAGVPVLAYARGSVPELIDPGVTGYCGDSIEDLVELVPRVLALDRRKLRAHAASRFDHRRMVDDYEALYERMVREGR
jgi:glycosyltransferase involved in cell wall biosynthesis